MTYWRYWRLNAAPFANDAAQPLFRGATVEEALARIEFLISNRRRVGSLLGVSGVGKSSLLRYVAQNPPQTEEVPSLQVFRTSMLGLSSGELLVDLATRLSGNRRAVDSPSAWKSLCDYFQAASRQSLQTVLLIDDTESSTTAAEADLSRLMAMAFSLTIVFSVETQLASAVSRCLFDRTELQIELPGWEISQTTEFLAWTAHRLGRKEPIFTDTAVQRIQALSEGIPRRIVQLADLALVAGAVGKADCVDAECVQQVAFELPRTSTAA
ncbi:MAG TPA: AAA family ATPase [Pirellulaceae bacterium]|nr:AAA family ATPase [Pirellulaceae bacterium]